jgi:general secretion pathway protein M
MNELKQWFLDQSPRDQMVLSAAAVVVGIFILLFLVLSPMQADLDKKQKRNLGALQEQQMVRDLAGQLLARQQSGQGGGNSNSLTSLLSESTRNFGLTMENIQPSGNTARLRLAAADFKQVLAWLNEMEIKQGLQVSDLTLVADKAPGTVIVNLQLAQGE